ncbi:sodium/sulfate symporter [Desulfovibrio sp. X2]|uniref:SLC13 family permease n=1 Tax=Desulfovibrio sp. X2 TaxID=941449 RepID=UPI000358E5A9|nr:SLC13 family permease [Desulfovibrio sp. X2]EPR39849.1 sodium/sulfate symporter [Desulfovibrio sp. X2]
MADQASAPLLPPRRPGLRHLLAWLVVLVAAAVLAAPSLLAPSLLAQHGLTPALVRGSSAIVLAVGFWALGTLPEFVTALLFFLVCMVFRLAPADVVFSGFQSSAVWLAFGGLILGAAIRRSGLAGRMVRLCLSRFSGGYAALMALLVAVGMGLAYFIPSSMARAVLVTPIAAGLAENLGFGPDSRGRMGVIAAAALGSTLPAFAILTSNVPNMVMAGASESIYGLPIHYGDYWLLNYPVLGLGSAALCILLLPFFFSEAPGHERKAAEPRPWSREEGVLSVVLLATLVLWATDSLHGIAPAWVALGAAVLCFLPTMGSPGDLLERVNFAPWLFIAGVTGMGAVAARIGLADEAGRLIAGFVPHGGFPAYAALLAIGAAVSLCTCHPAAPAVLTPLAATLAQASGWPLQSVLMAQVPAWVVFPFLYQAPPLIVALSLGRVPLSKVMPMFLTYFVLAAVLLLPLHYLWGRLLGVFP